MCLPLLVPELLTRCDCVNSCTPALAELQSSRTLKASQESSLPQMKRSQRQLSAISQARIKVWGHLRYQFDAAP